MKRQLIAASIIAAGTVGLAGAAMVGAESASGSNPMQDLASAIASKFNLKEADVQTVIDEQRTQMQAKREQEIKDQVAQLVTDGKLTQAQADKINAKRTELQQEREANRTADQDKTEAERQANREAHKTEIDKWLSDNGIDDDYQYLLMGGRGKGGGFGGHRGGQTN